MSESATYGSLLCNFLSLKRKEILFNASDFLGL